MMSWKTECVVVCVSLTLVLSACGGSGTSAGVTGAGESGGAGVIEPQSGAANPGNGETPDATGDTADPASGQGDRELDGRVADGYIRGALVCVDLNENRDCDADEPASVSGAGGVFSLTIPDAGNGKPVVAAIPADAIDEDTGQVVGQKRVFVAPADRPAFISPITTLIDAQQQDDPSLDIVGAERLVKRDLGLETAGSISLFQDYVAAEQNASEAAIGNTFRYVHDTARVVAELLGDIRARVEQGADSAGIDADADDDARRALGAIIARETRLLLPDIAREVAVLIDSAPGGAESDGAMPLDRDRIAAALFPAERLQRIGEGIRTQSEVPVPVSTDLQAAFDKDLYWIESDCGAADVALTQSEAIDIGDPEGQRQTMTPCDASYVEASLADDGTRLSLAYHDYDQRQGAWVRRSDQVPQPVDRLALVQGAWMSVRSTDGAGPITFPVANEALVSTSEGSLRLSATSRDVSGQSLVGHLWRDAAAPDLIAAADEGSRFDAGARVHALRTEQSSPEFVLASPGSRADPSCGPDGACPGVVDLGASDVRLSSLAQIRERAVPGIDLGGVARESRSGLPVVLSLSAEPDEDGSLPLEGRLRWRYVDPGASASTKALAPADANGQSVTLLDGNDRFVTGRESAGNWRIIEAQGLRMIELDVPLGLHQRLDLDGESTLLLGEYDDAVAVGARVGGPEEGNLVSYDAAAFKQIRGVYETYLETRGDAAGQADADGGGDDAGAIIGNPGESGAGEPGGDSGVSDAGTGGSPDATEGDTTGGGLDNSGGDTPAGTTSGDSGGETSGVTAGETAGEMVDPDAIDAGRPVALPLSDGWLVNDSDERSPVIMEQASNQGIAVNVLSVESRTIDGTLYTRVASNGIPNYRTRVDEALIERLAARPDPVADFRNASAELAVNDVVEFAQDIGYARSDQRCAVTGGSGYWPPGQECPPGSAKRSLFRASPEPTDAVCRTGPGAIGWFANGTSIHGWNTLESHRDQGVWQLTAAGARHLDQDICNGHAVDGDYHHHGWSPCLAEQVGDTGEGHSPRYGLAADGYPVHGPWHDTGVLVSSSWVLRDYDDANSPSGCGVVRERSCLLVDPDNLSAGTEPAASAGPSTTDIVTTPSGYPVTAVPGLYLQDYYHDPELAMSGAHHLDRHNGHDHDGIGYHYHLSVRADDTGTLRAAFPFAVGPTYHGVLDGNALAACAAPDTPAGAVDGEADTFGPPSPPQ